MIFSKAKGGTFFLRPPAPTGKESDFGENVSAAWDAYRVSPDHTEASDISLDYVQTPLLEEMQKQTGMDDRTFWSIVHHGADPLSRGYVRKPKLANEAIYNYIQLNPEYRSFVESKYPHLDIDSGVDALMQSTGHMALEHAQATKERYEKIKSRQTTGGLFGQGLGNVAGFVSDPVEQIGFTIGGPAKGVIKKIAIASAINVGIETVKLPSLQEWHEKLTGEEFSATDFAKRAGFIVAGTSLVMGAIEGVTRVPIRNIIRAASDSIGRKLRTSEEVELIELLFKNKAESQGKEYIPDKDFEAWRNQQDADKIITSKGKINDDTNNTQHNTLFLRGFNAILRNDVKGVNPSQTAKIKAPNNIYEGETNWGFVDDIDLDKLEIDTKTFQIKEDVGALAGVKEWDAARAGHILVYETKAGKRILIDGHQRVAAAKRLKVKEPLKAIVLKENEGFNPLKAKISGAIRNLYEGSLDKAGKKFLRKFPEIEKMIQEVNPHAIMLNSLSKVSPRGLLLVHRAVVDADTAAKVGGSISDESQQIAMFDILNKKKIAPEDMDQFIKDTVASGELSKYNMDDLDDSIAALYLDKERGNMINTMLRSLKKEQRLLKKQAKKADDKLINKRITQNENTIEAIQASAEYGGQLSDIITRGAKELKSLGDESFGEAAESLQRVSQQATDDIRRGVDDGSIHWGKDDGAFPEGSAKSEYSDSADATRQEKTELDVYSDGATSKQIEVENKAARASLDARSDIARFKDDLDKIDEHDSILEFIEGCKIKYGA